MTMTIMRAAAACADPAMPFMELALNRAYIEREFRSLMGPCARLGRIRVVGWKPGRRTVVEYDVENSTDAGVRRTLVGKLRAKSLDVSAFRLARQLSARSFAPDSADGISVPPVIGSIPECHMWLQEKVQGVSGWEAVTQPDGARAARTIGRVLAKLQRSLPSLGRKHGVDDEIAQLRAVLSRVSAGRPEWGGRLDDVQRGCERLAAAVGHATTSGVHRDFNHDQVIVGPERTWILELDLAAEGDPALDVGNFTAHIAEQSLRRFGNADALAREEAEFISSYFEAGGRAAPPAIETYKTLSLARHIYLSTAFEERRPYTQALLTLCEHRLRL
jgi:hypothetical protein